MAHITESTELDYPFKWRQLTNDEALDQQYFDSKHKHHYETMKVEGGSLVLPKNFAQSELPKKIYNMKVREDDIWIVTYPKCGTTWAQVGEACTKIRILKHFLYHSKENVQSKVGLKFESV